MQEPKSQKLLGLDNVLKRLAWHYAKKGNGWHVIEHPLYTRVRVRELYDWHTPADDRLPPQGGIVVEFWNQEKRLRWVEFGVHYIGGGGEDLIREV